MKTKNIIALKETFWQKSVIPTNQQAEAGEWDF